MSDSCCDGPAPGQPPRSHDVPSQLDLDPMQPVAGDGVDWHAAWKRGPVNPNQEYPWPRGDFVFGWRPPHDREKYPRDHVAQREELADPNSNWVSWNPKSYDLKDCTGDSNSDERRLRVAVVAFPFHGPPAAPFRAFPAHGPLFPFVPFLAVPFRAAHAPFVPFHVVHVLVVRAVPSPSHAAIHVPVPPHGLWPYVPPPVSCVHGN